MRLRSWLSISLSVFILLGGTAAVYMLDQRWDNPVVEAASALGKPGMNPSAAQVKHSLKELIQVDQKKVVSIEVDVEEGKATGSGFIYNDKGDIVTNAHVVLDATGITVKASDGSLYVGKLIGINPEKDIALLRAEGLAGREPLAIDAETNVDIGDEVMAFGSPLGLDNTVTTGIISGVDRDFEIEETNYKGLYQISAPITHGNSGGPLVLQASGKVIGINTAVQEQGAIGFSIPIGQVKAMLEAWSQHPDEELAKRSTATSGTGGTDNEVYTKEAMSDGADYIVQRFYESIGSKDYVNAYSLLGSDWQTKTDYEAFRKGYLYTLEVYIKNISITSADSQSAIVDVIIEATEDKQGSDVVVNSYSVQYTVKPENGLLKLISGKGKKL
ncbi:S1C family serine protease [Paenibacillus sp. OV219]|uniref:S1C family serine protease n=1 Tax=Paenibacillus sp. OV219 TaxID=1884377 RepID=UPI0008C6CF2B|nr:trypsin-like peptidase domain-containing protein [Paenibacillus sp. OV219]SEM90956.1 Trypsin-like peptidase domain-containing protein [Paenibacillus sp. OV219]